MRQISRCGTLARFSADYSGVYILSLHLITGGSGFVGSTIARLLHARGEQVRVFDLWQDDELPAGIDFIGGDINDEAAVERAMSGVDYVHHNVALVPLTKAGRRFHTVNVEGTAVALRAAHRHNVKMFSHMSSSAIFGAPEQMPITNQTPLQPIEIYGRAKLSAEQLLWKAGVEGLRVSAVRPRTIIGTRRLGIFEILFSWINDGANIYVIGSGDEPFQFVHVDDLAEVSIQCCLQEKMGLYNVGTDQFGSLRSDLQTLIDHAETSTKIRRLPVGLTIGTLKFLDVMRLSPLGPWHYLTYHKPFHFDSSSVRETLGWRPKYSNVEMLKQSYDWYVANRHSELSEAGSSMHKAPVKQRLLKPLKMISRWV